MKATISATCAAAVLGILIGRTTVVSSPLVTEAVSQRQIVADISTMPIVPAAAAASGDFGYGPTRTTDW